MVTLKCRKEKAMKMKAYLVLVDGRASQVAYSTPKKAIEFIMSRSHPIMNIEGWHFEAIDKDGRVTHYQITDVTIEGVK